MDRFGILLLVGLVAANDLAVGPANVGKQIFSEKKEASPAIWRQVHNVTINATNDEIINSIAILDLRPEKDGEATIVDGGIGYQNVTIELKSPAVFRGYEFQIEAYSVPKSEFKGVLPEHKVSPHNEISRNVPVLIGELEKETRQIRKTEEHSSIPTAPSSIKPDQPITVSMDPSLRIDETIITDNETDITTPKHDDDKLKAVPEVLADERHESTVPPTTEDDAQIIDINGQSPAIGNTKTHEEQGGQNERDMGAQTGGHETTARTNGVSTVAPNHSSSTGETKVHESTQHNGMKGQDFEEQNFHETKKDDMMPLPYINQ